MEDFQKTITDKFSLPRPRIVHKINLISRVAKLSANLIIVTLGTFFDQEIEIENVKIFFKGGDKQ